MMSLEKVRARDRQAAIDKAVLEQRERIEMRYPQLTVKTTQEVTGRIQELNRDYVAKAEDNALKAMRREEYRITEEGAKYLLSIK